ncbi:acyl carrier protein [Pectobacterium versatile]|uniref:acyl carrier protein n=1 Tax=Pectobacterium versatile TaxID=2488639 RepID=UPI001CC948F3|nr:acyl carrier protein [Pectobacterium versatile]
MNALLMKDNVFALICDVIYQVNGIAPDEIKAQDSLIKDIAMDSVELVDFLIKLEDLGLVLDRSQITSDLTVEQVVEFMMAEFRR